MVIQLSNFKTEFQITIGVIVLVFIINFIFNRFNNKFPPGPIGFPLLGYIPFLTRDVHLKFTELGKKYGDIFSVTLGSVTLVVLNKAEDIREAFAKPEFNARPPHTSFSIFDDKSPFFVSGVRIWQDQRRFVVHSLKNLGLGRTKIEGQIQEEIREFINILKTYRGDPMNLNIPLTSSMSNNICSLAFGKRYDYDDPERKMLDAGLHDVIKIIGQTASHIFFPWIRHFPFILKMLKYDEGVKAFRRSHSLFWKKLEEHKETIDPDNIRDFIDGYLIEMRQRQKNDPYTTFNEETLIGCVGDLFGAGSESVRATVSWCVYIMAAFRDVQKKVQQEISEVLLDEREPEFLDQKSMPYTHAVILEVMRWKSIVPLNVPRYTTADTTIGEYKIPKGTTVMANFWAVHHDPRHWEDPDSFLPERFLEPDRKSIRKSSSYMPFSVGKRACPGETMAYMEVFLYFVSILQNFNVMLPKEVKPTFEAELTVTYQLKPYLVQFIPRN
ncbi:cytochrome P450 2J6-like [Parasteatoda tepidariorum]|uniref:cytochrome P450 2J6-like n=1 Tax=Parasteatoda tepidariorum TaxID=114398 RepID=UPI00077FC32E|nr:cytochrome P450 2J6-like [Parasteatoda tepidariorum]